jgi:hypothetical protein
MSEAALSKAKDPVRSGRKSGTSPQKRGRFRRILLGVAGVGTLGVIGTWVAIHRFDWAGPLVANTLRAVIGVDNVAKLEDFVYGVEDRVNRSVRGTEAPKPRWTVPEAPSAAPAETAAPAASSTATKVVTLPPFKPQDPGPALKQWSAKGDGIWVPIVDPRRPDEEPYMMKTLLHPDVTRGWAEVFVVAVDLRRADVFMVAGTQEPKEDRKLDVPPVRTGVIPAHHHEELLAAFNGGFMTEHGGYGMLLDGVTIVTPKPNACTFALYQDGSLRIATWKNIAETEKDMVWYRQAPECMVENGKLHPGLTYGAGLKWGATLDGETVIRRSAIGLNAERDILYVSITNHTTARVLADGLKHAGAVDIAQLDVNWSYPKFVLFEPKTPGGERKAVALADGFEFSEDEYIRKKNRRDFFYLVRKPKN